MGAGVAEDGQWSAGGGRSGDPPAIVDLTATIGVNGTTTCPRQTIPAVRYEFSSNRNADSTSTSPSAPLPTPLTPQLTESPAPLLPPEIATHPPAPLRQ